VTVVYRRFFQRHWSSWCISGWNRQDPFRRLSKLVNVSSFSSQ